MNQYCHGLNACVKYFCTLHFNAVVTRLWWGARRVVLPDSAHTAFADVGMLSIPASRSNSRVKLDYASTPIVAAAEAMRGRPFVGHETYFPETEIVTSICRCHCNVIMLLHSPHNASSNVLT